MENFNQNFNHDFNKNELGPEEKDIYSLNLDKSRIIIISVVFVAIIAVSFLIGMKVSDGSKEDDLFTGKDYPSNRNVETVKQYDSFIETGNNLENEAIGNIDNGLQSNVVNDANKPVQVQPPAQTIPAADIFSGNNQVILPNKTAVIPADTAKVSASKKSVKDVKTKETAEKKKKSKVTAVSGATIDDDEPKSVKIKSASGYSIQVASFDTKEKASAEMKKLESMDLDSFVDKTTVNGKKYYRVKVGPFSSKKKALTTYDELIENEKFEDSFITNE